MTHFDVIVVGAGHNGLTLATYLARRGRRVVILEARSTPGGLASGVALKGAWRSECALVDTSTVQRSVIEDLGLHRYGLRWQTERPPVLCLGDPGSHFVLGGAAETSTPELARYRAYIDEVSDVLLPALQGLPPDLVFLNGGDGADLWKHAIRIRRAGSDRLLELSRVLPMSCADWLGEWFTSSHVQAAVALPGVACTTMGPRSPGSTATLLRYECLSNLSIDGGAVQLVRALEKAALEAGVTIRNRAPVAELRVVDGSVRSAVLDQGEEIVAPIVAATCDPKQLFEKLLAPDDLSMTLRRRVKHIRCRGTTALVLLALREPLRYSCKVDEHVTFARIAPSMDAIERAFDATKYGRASPQPVLDVYNPVGEAGGSVLHVLFHFAPTDLAGGWSDDARQKILRSAIETLAVHAPGIREVVDDSWVLAPPDLEEEYGITGGQVHHGEHALDQLLIRPTPECARFTTPIKGLFLAGSGSHPGGGLTCLPGALAAGQILNLKP